MFTSQGIQAAVRVAFGARVTRMMGRTVVPSLVRSALAMALASSAQAADPSSQIGFIDVADSIHFRYISNNDFTGRKYFPQPMCGGVAILDADADGRLDIYFTNGASLPDLDKSDPAFHSCLLRNIGDGQFEDGTDAAGLSGQHMDFSFGAAAGDFDNDGDTDLFVCNAGPNVLYLNEGDGTFTDITAGSGLDEKQKDLLSVAAAWFDYDNDSLPDLVVSQYTFWNPVTDRRCATSEGKELYCSPQTVTSVPHSLYRNLGNGRFEDVTESSGFARARGKGMGIGIADFDRDGHQDVFIANDTEPNFLYMNGGDGTFEEAALYYLIAHNDIGARVSAMGADAKDYDNDGWVDVFYNNLQHQRHALFRNREGTLFEYVSPSTNVGVSSNEYSGWSAGFIDYDNDGWKDIYSANGDVDYFGDNSRQHDTMLHSVRGEHFEDVSNLLGPDFLHVGYQRGSAFADLNDDGFMDLVVTSLGEKPRILLNSAGSGNHWLLLDLRGRRSHRDAVGAMVKVTTASGRRLYNHVSPSVGFMSTSDRRVHFGLGEEGAVHSIEITWPSGSTQTVEAPVVDRIHVIEETSDSSDSSTEAR